jgi:hypothetical protein
VGSQPTKKPARMLPIVEMDLPDDKEATAGALKAGP